MPKYVIERDIPGAGDFPDEKWKEASQKSLAALKELGPDIQWVQSYITDDKVFCVYIAPSEAWIRQHAEKSGIVATSIRPLARVIDPTTGGA